MTTTDITAAASRLAVGTRIRNRRVELAATMPEFEALPFARRLGITVGHLYHVETGRVGVSAELLERIASLLGLDAHRLLAEPIRPPGTGGRGHPDAAGGRGAERTAPGGLRQGLPPVPAYRHHDGAGGGEDLGAGAAPGRPCDRGHAAPIHAPGRRRRRRRRRGNREILVKGEGKEKPMF